MPREKRVGVFNPGQEHIPDGVGLAEQLGAKCENASLNQFHPTGILQPKSLRRERLPETMRAAGARILDKNFTEFVDPLTTRNKLTDAIVNCCDNGFGVVTDDGYQGVWLMTPDIDELNGKGYTASNYPKFYNLFIENNHDISLKPVLIYPIVHYSLGGIAIDENAETTVRGVFAAGETTWGVHGEERLMGNSLLDIFVFGKLAGKNAAQAALRDGND